MSNLKEREERNCLNCTAEVAGRYCQVCGQENIQTQESTWHLISHFFSDITHYDGKFFSTLRWLIVKPGFLSQEYRLGRRSSYLNPVRMYVFTSAIFFFTFFSLFHVDERDIGIQGFSDKAINAMDSTQFANFTKKITKGLPMSRDRYKNYMDSTRRSGGIHLTSHNYKSLVEYDSILALGKKKHNWFEKTLIHREIAVNKKYNNDQVKILAAFITQVQHSFPQLLFISLPLFALILKALYFRRKYYYADHLILSIHFYVFLFFAMLLIIFIHQLPPILSTLVNWITFSLGVYMLVYEYLAMKRYYQQGTGKTLVKFIILNVMHFLVILALFFLFIVFSFLNI